ncbi:MAG: hypothetical protein EOP24_35135 [Hyphomicrobiales bacterium]|nr:MAG: hypothetical protein EOP24_35135 [Hyphomicrobiales bacterium]
MIPAMPDTPVNGSSPSEPTAAAVPVASSAQDAAPFTAPAAAPVRWSVWTWALEGLRAGFFLRPRFTGRVVEAPGPWQVLALFVLAAALQTSAERFTVPGDAHFQPIAWLASWWVSLVALWCAWCAMPRAHFFGRADEGAGARLAAWFALTSWAPMPAILLTIGLQAWAAQAPGWAQAWQQPLWWVQLALMAWTLAAFLWASAPFFPSRWRTAGFSLAMVALFGAGMWAYPGPVWTEDYSANAVPEPEPLHLSQDVFEAQQALWQRQVQGLAAQRDGVVDVYGLVFAPYASENVFRRESTMVREVLEQRFGARGRVIQLLNHAQTATTHVWATPQNLQRAVAALGARMDREHDVLVVYLTSHGGQDHQLAASHWPLEVPSISPEVLRQALDDAGIRHRVIAVSACFSGGWIEPLATDTTLVMTAADATHTSYGCGRRSELTFFGRAMFDEQLRSTRSFTQAFANAVPLIRQREIDAGKDDGFSNPQISVGAGIAPVLDALAARLDSEPSD